MRALLVAVAVLAALTVVAALAVPPLVDWTPHRERIAREVGEALDRPVRLDGPIDLALLPRPRLTADRATLPARSPDGAALAVERLGLVLDPRALLGGRIVVERIELVRPDFVLSAPVGESPLRALAEALAPSPVDVDAPLGTVTVDIEDGRLRIDRAASASVHVVESVSARLQRRNGILHAEGDFGLGDRRAGFDLIASPGRTGRGAWRVRLRQSETGAGLTVTAAMAEDGRVTGEVSLEAAQPGQLVATLVPALGDLDDVAARAGWLAEEKPMRARARLDAGADRWALEDLLVESGETRARGALALLPLKERPRLTADLRVGRIALSSLPSPSLPALRDALATRDPDGPGVGGVDLDAMIVVDALAVGGISARQVVTEIEVARDQFRLRRLAAELPGAANIGVAFDAARHEERWMLAGEVRGAAGSLRDLLVAAGVDLTGLPPDRLRRAELWSELRSDGDRLSVDRLDIRLDGAELSGEGELALTGEPAARLALAVDRVDLDGFLPAIDGPLAPGLVAAARALADGMPPLEMPGLDGPSLRLDLLVDRVVHGAVDARGLEISANWRGSAVDLRRLAVADFAGAELFVSGRIQDLGASPTATLQVDADTTVPGATLRRLWGSAPSRYDRFGRGWLSGFATVGASEGELDIELGLGGLTAAFEGSFRGDSGRGRIVLRHADAAALVADLVGGERGRGTARALDVAADAELGGRTARLEGVRIAIGDARLEGRGRIHAGRERPHIALALRGTDLDLGPLALLLHSDVNEGGALHRPLDLSPLRALDGELTLEANALRAGGIILTRPTARMSLGDGALSLDRLDAGLSGGAVAFSARVADRAVPRIEIGLDVSDARLAPGAIALGPFRIGDGIAEARVRLASEGRTLWALVAAAQGEARLRLRGGEIEGLAGEGWGERLLAVPAGLGVHDRLVSAATGGTATLRDLVLPVAVDAGVARAEEVRLVASDVVGEGTARLDIARGALRIALALEPRGEPPLPPVRLTLVGPLAGPDLHIAAPELIDLLIRRQVGLDTVR